MLNALAKRNDIAPIARVVLGHADGLHKNWIVARRISRGTIGVANLFTAPSSRAASKTLKVPYDQEALSEMPIFDKACVTDGLILARHPGIHSSSVQAIRKSYATEGSCFGVGPEVQVAMSGDYDGDMVVLLRTALNAWRKFAARNHMCIYIYIFAAYVYIYI